ncbi:cytochrome c3 family protein [Thermosulfuriphilus sp.]
MVFLPGLAQAARCRQCHPLEDQYNSSVHPPFIEDRCDVCHGQDRPKEGNQTINTKNVKWFLERYQPGGTAYILLPGRLRRYDLIFESKDPLFQKRLSLSSLPDAPRGPKPNILEAKLCGLEHGPWWEAKICVKTDIPTEAEINCQDVQGFSEGDFFTYQVISLTGLKDGKTYQCLLTVRDLYGQSSQTKISFRVGHPFALPSPPKAHIISVEIYQTADEEPLLAVKSDGALSWHLGTVPKQTASKNNSSAGHHKNLNPPVVAGLDACFKCHDSHSLGATHPVNVHLRQGMLAEGIPVFNGVVTCASCHNPHSAKEPYLLRKRGRSLCLSCHGQRYR